VRKGENGQSVINPEQLCSHPWTVPAAIKAGMFQ
jgi:hypothetical protein